MEEQSGYMPLARHHDEHQYGTLCVQQIWTDTMARSYWSLSLRPAEQGHDRRSTTVIYPDDSQPKTGGKCLLIAITVQPEDALALMNKYDSLLFNG